MKRKIVLIGGGGHCKSVLNTIYRIGFYDEIVVTDKGYPGIKDILGIPVVGNDDRLPELRQSGYTDAFITLGSIKSTELRHLLYEKAVNLGFHLPCIVDPSAQVSKHTSLGVGIFIGQNTVVNADVRIGDMAIINTGAIIEHECIIGSYSHISVGAKLCGAVSVGEDVLVGAGAVVIQGVQIGIGALIGAGSVVLGDVKGCQTVVGLVKQG